MLHSQFADRCQFYRFPSLAVELRVLYTRVDTKIPVQCYPAPPRWNPPLGGKHR